MISDGYLDQVFKPPEGGIEVVIMEHSVVCFFVVQEEI